MNSEQMMHSGMQHHRSGRLAEAEDSYRKVLEGHPGHADATQLLGIVAAQRGDSDTAIHLIRESIRLKPDQAGPYRNLAPLLAKKGQFEEAITAYRKFLEFRPDSPEILRDLGAALKECGRLDEALTAISRAIALKPDFFIAYNELGNIATLQNRQDDAIAAYSKAIALKPDFSEAHNNLGNVLVIKNRSDDAIASYRRAIQYNPNLAAAHNGLGNVLRRNGRNDESINAYLTAIRIKPDFALAHFNLAQAYRVAAQPEEVLAAFLAASKIEPNNAEIHANMAIVLAEMQRFEEAMTCQARLAALKPEAAITHEVLGKILLENRNAAEAVVQFRRALAIDPNCDTSWLGLGTALQSQGKFDEAAKCFRKLLEICPPAGAGVVYRHLIDTGRADADETDIERLQAIVGDDTMPAVSRVAARFALAKTFDEWGRFDEAFETYAAANSIIKQLRASVGEVYDPEAVQRLNREMVEVFTREYFQERRNWGSSSDVPVFVVGMPRSGTTLVQQIAASHPHVHGAGELSDIADITRKIGGADVKSAAMGWTSDVFTSAAEGHVERLRAIGGGAQRVIDKMPTNVHRLALIALLFPAARVIFCRRDARDTCLSCFFQWFAVGNTFSFDLAHCGHEYLATEQLMTHWKGAIPLPILEVQYEDLVADLEGQSRRLIDFLGLPWDPACLEFHRKETTVLTSSSWQVRQPIYRKSAGRWRNYERHLGPLMQVLDHH